MRKRRPAGQILRRAFPIARYLAVLLISLNVQQLPAETWLLPGVNGSRRWLMGWVVLLLVLDRLVIRKYRRIEREDSLSFLALAVPGLFLLDAAGIVHLYLSWFYSGKDVPAQPNGAAVSLLMAAGCVLWIYGAALPVLPFGSIWGIRTRSTMASEEIWGKTHRKAAAMVPVIGIVCLITGTLLL